MLKFIIITLCVLFLLRILGRFFIVRTFNSLNKKMQDEMNRQRGASRTMPEGSITIDPGVTKQQNQQKRKNDNDDYVDFEEVK